MKTIEEKIRKHVEKLCVLVDELDVLSIETESGNFTEPDFVGPKGCSGRYRSGRCIYWHLTEGGCSNCKYYNGWQ